MKGNCKERKVRIGNEPMWNAKKGNTKNLNASNAQKEVVQYETWRRLCEEMKI